MKSMCHLVHTTGRTPALWAGRSSCFAWRRERPPLPPAALGRRCHRPGSSSLVLPPNAEVFALESGKDPSQPSRIFFDSEIGETAWASGPVTATQFGWRPGGCGQPSILGKGWHSGAQLCEPPSHLPAPIRLLQDVLQGSSAPGPPRGPGMTHLRMEPSEEGLACQGRSLRLDGTHTMPRGGLACGLGSDEMLLQGGLLPEAQRPLECPSPQAPSRL